MLSSYLLDYRLALEGGGVCLFGLLMHHTMAIYSLLFRLFPPSPYYPFTSAAT